MAMMRCEDVEHALLEHPTSQDPARPPELAAHLAGCPACHENAFEVEAAVVQIQSTPLRDPGPDLARSVMAKLALPDPAIVETGWMERLGHVWPRVRTGSVALAAALAVAVLFARWSSRATWQVQTAGAMRAIVPGRMIQVESGDRAVLRRGPVELVAEAGTRLEPANDELVRLHAGKVWVQVTPGSPFRLVAGEVEMDVRGTCFTVASSQHGVRLEVHEGAVRARARERSVLATAGSAYTFHGEAPPRRESVDASSGWPSIIRAEQPR